MHRLHVQVVTQLAQYCCSIASTLNRLFFRILWQFPKFRMLSSRSARVNNNVMNSDMRITARLVQFYHLINSKINYVHNHMAAGDAAAASALASNDFERDKCRLFSPRIPRRCVCQCQRMCHFRMLPMIFISPCLYTYKYIYSYRFTLPCFVRHLTIDFRCRRSQLLFMFAVFGRNYLFEFEV